MRGSVQKKGSKYYAVVYIGGKQKWFKAGDKKREAERFLNELIKELDDGTYRQIQKSTFEEFTKLWLNDDIKHKVKSSTFIRYEGVINNYLIPHFGQYQLSDIAPAMIQKFISAEIKKGKLSSSSVKTILIVLKAVFKRAVILSYLKHNPAQNIEGPKVVHKEGSILTPAEIRKLLEVAEEPWRTLFMVAAMTGMRRGEILALKWSDIDFEKKLVFVRRSVFRSEFSDPKSKKSIRVLAMDDRLLSVILNHKINAPASEHDLVFCTPDGGIVSGGHVTKVQFKKAIKDAGIEKPMRFHDLRHSFASLLISKGEHVKVIQSVLGHADIQTTMNIYGHLLPETHIESAAKVSSAIFDE